MVAEGSHLLGDAPSPSARETAQLTFSFGAAFASAFPARSRRSRRLPRAPRGEQPMLPFAVESGAAASRDGKALGEALAEHLGRPVRVTVTDNRRTVLSWRNRDGLVAVRAHHMFVDADAGVVLAVGRWIASRDRRASATIDQFVELNRERLRAAVRGNRRSGPPNLRTAGRHHDLETMSKDLGRRFFGGEIDTTVGWGRRGPRGRPRRSIRLGSYSPEDRVIRIHPALDQAFVPRYFVASVLFHEMLHHVLGTPPGRGRRQWHSKVFRAREREFPDWEKAQRWEELHIRRLLRG